MQRGTQRAGAARRDDTAPERQAGDYGPLTYMYMHMHMHIWAQRGCRSRYVV